MPGQAQEATIHIELGGVPLEPSNSACPLRKWNTAVTELTGLAAARDIREPY